MTRIAAAALTALFAFDLIEYDGEDLRAREGTLTAAASSAKLRGGSTFIGPFGARG